MSSQIRENIKVVKTSESYNKWNYSFPFGRIIGEFFLIPFV